MSGRDAMIPQHSGWIERRAARRRDGTGVGESRPASAGGMGEAGSARELRRLEAPARRIPHMDQHQRFPLRVFGEERAGLYLRKVSI